MKKQCPMLDCEGIEKNCAMGGGKSLRRSWSAESIEKSLEKLEEEEEKKKKKTRSLV